LSKEIAGGGKGLEEEIGGGRKGWMEDRLLGGLKNF
jgi:hypothetical protein